MTKTRRSKIWKKHRGSIIILLVVALFGISVLGVGMKMRAQNEKREARIQELESMIAEEEERAKELEEYRKYIQTKKYIEEVAKEKLGLVYPDEIIFKARE